MNIGICYNTIMVFSPDKFQEFIQDKFAEWRGKGRDTLKDFANFLGVSQQLMSNWYNGKFKRPPETESVRLLVEKYGGEVYEVLGLPTPDDPIDSLPEPLRSIASEFKGTLEEKNLTADSPEAKSLLDEIMKKHGYRLTSTTD